MSIDEIMGFYGLASLSILTILTIIVYAPHVFIFLYPRFFQERNKKNTK